MRRIVNWICAFVTVAGMVVGCAGIVAIADAEHRPIIGAIFVWLMALIGWSVTSERE